MNAKEILEKVAAKDPRYVEAASSVPTLARRAKNFLSAVVGHAADGFRKVDEKTYGERLAKCVTCPRLTPGWVCAHQDCGCDVRKKAGWRSEKCPEGKWELPTVGGGGCGCGSARTNENVKGQGGVAEETQ